MSLFDDPLAAAQFLLKGYVMCRVTRDQTVTGYSLETNKEAEVFIPGGTVGLAVPTEDNVPKWYLPQLTPPDTKVGDTGLTFAEVYEAEGQDVFELLLPYTGHPEDEEETA